MSIPPVAAQDPAEAGRLPGVATTAVEEFEAQRPRLFGLAYRLLGSADDAQDVVQDAFVRWSVAHHATIAAPAAWLTTVVTNLALTRLTSARARRECYAGPWLPEPVLTADGTLGPLDTAEQRDTVSLALLMVMERLTPTERAVFVLREAFAYPYGEIARILRLSDTNCRQLHRRAARHLAGHARFGVDAGQWRALVGRFLAAAADGDLGALEQLLAADVMVWADGGGRAPAGRRPVMGRARAVRLFAGAARKFADLRFSEAEANGAPAVLAWRGERLFGVAVPQVVDGRITALLAVSNPDKLRFVQRQALTHVTSGRSIQSYL